MQSLDLVSDASVPSKSTITLAEPVIVPYTGAFFTMRRKSTQIP